MATATKTKYKMHVMANCPFCEKAKALLNSYEVQFDMISEKSPDWPTFPVIYKQDNENVSLIGGFNELLTYSRKHGL
jgi:glutaredoxin